MEPNPRLSLLSEAVRYLGTKEEPKGSNRGVRIDAWLDTVGSPLGSPWCAAFVWSMGLQATGRPLWPVRMSGRVQTIVEHAEREAWFTKDPLHARTGDLAVFWYPALNRYGHIGIVESVATGRVITIDGNTAPDAAAGSAADREGYGVFRKNRPVTERVAFIRWAA